MSPLFPLLAAMFCEDCSCRSCMNTLEHADLVQRHRQTILARSPKAFDAKVHAPSAWRAQLSLRSVPLRTELGRDRVQSMKMCIADAGGRGGGAPQGLQVPQVPVLEKGERALLSPSV